MRGDGTMSALGCPESIPPLVARDGLFVTDGEILDALVSLGLEPPYGSLEESRAKDWVEVVAAWSLLHSTLYTHTRQRTTGRST